MEKGKIIVIEGTDCSGKETQTNKLIERLNEEGIKTVKLGFPNYDSPTGKIVGGPYLGKEWICPGWFKELAPNVDPKVSCLYYAADRKYNIGIVNNNIDNGINVILDRYVYSNMAHQGGKIQDREERIKMFDWISKLEFDLLELPIPDIKIFLHMPTDYAVELRKNRQELGDQNENDINHLYNAEKTYLEMASIYGFETIECVRDNQIKSIDTIHEEVYKYVRKLKK